MNDDLGAHDIEELRALMREHHLLPEIPEALLAPPAPGSSASRPSAGRAVGATAASEAMLASILATPRPAAGTAPTNRRQARSGRPGRVRRRGAALAVASAAVVVAVVGSQMSSTPEAVAGGAPALGYSLGSPADAWDASLPSARETLLDLAEVADDSPDLPRTGDVQYVSLYSWLSELDAGTETTTVYPTADQRWTAPDGARRIVQRRAEAVSYDGTLDTSAGRSAAGAESTDDVLPGVIDAFDAAELLTDPDTLVDALLEQVPTESAEDPVYRDAALVDSVVAQFDASIVPQDVVSAMWTVLAGAPSVRTLGETTDRLGRPGVAVAVPDTVQVPDGREVVTVLIISPTDGQLMGTETVTLSDPLLEIDSKVDEPTVTGFTAVTDRSWVTAVGE